MIDLIIEPDFLINKEGNSEEGRKVFDCLQSVFEVFSSYHDHRDQISCVISYALFKLPIYKINGTYNDQIYEIMARYSGFIQWTDTAQNPNTVVDYERFYPSNGTPEYMKSIAEYCVQLGDQLSTHNIVLLPFYETERNRIFRSESIQYSPSLADPQSLGEMLHDILDKEDDSEAKLREYLSQHWPTQKNDEESFREIIDYYCQLFKTPQQWRYKIEGSFLGTIIGIKATDNNNADRVQFVSNLCHHLCEQEIKDNCLYKSKKHPYGLGKYDDVRHMIISDAGRLFYRVIDHPSGGKQFVLYGYDPVHSYYKC